MISITAYKCGINPTETQSVFVYLLMIKFETGTHMTKHLETDAPFGPDELITGNKC